MDIEKFFKKVGTGIILSILSLTLIYSLKGGNSIGELFLKTSLPINDTLSNPSTPLMKYNSSAEDELNEDSAELTELIGIGDVIFQTEEDIQENQTPAKATPPATTNLDLLKNLEYLKKNYYIVDKKTGISSDYFDINKFMSANLKITPSADKPKVLVFHTHSKEMFKDSKAGDINEGIVGAGTRLCQRLEEKGIKTLHITDSFDVVNGKSQILGAYERMEPTISKALKDNPSIEVVIDLHRDGVNENTHLVQTINGKPTAEIMFFNGLCRLNKNGKLNEIASLKNPYIPTNLALSFNMKKTADELYPNLTRKIYLNAYRYSLHLSPKSMLIEVGAQTNTKQEIYNAIDLLAEVIKKVIT